MEDVIDELRERNEPVPVPLELPDEETLVEIQEQILIHLPHDLREFLLTVSDVVYGHLEPVTASDPYCHTFLPEVAATAWDLGLPRHLVVVCYAEPLYYAADEEGEVFAWDSATAELLEETWESVWHWARDVWLES
ncbi:MAG TPA: SMI1/KNR4 family protein [Thiopseudomonas sp.]|nr:SMI1/KNR4 family protein [Thiopseudomonas sp.]